MGSLTGLELVVLNGTVSVESVFKIVPFEKAILWGKKRDIPNPVPPDPIQASHVGVLHTHGSPRDTKL